MAKVKINFDDINREYDKEIKVEEKSFDNNNFFDDGERRITNNSNTERRSRFNRSVEENWLLKAFCYPFIFRYILYWTNVVQIANPYKIFDNNLNYSKYENKQNVKVAFYAFKALVYIPLELSILAGILYVLFIVALVVLGLAVVIGIIGAFAD